MTSSQLYPSLSPHPYQPMEPDCGLTRDVPAPAAAPVFSKRNTARAKLFRWIGPLISLLFLFPLNIVPVTELGKCGKTRKDCLPKADIVVAGALLLLNTLAGGCLLSAGCCRCVRKPSRLFFPALLASVSDSSPALHCSQFDCHKFRSATPYTPWCA